MSIPLQALLLPSRKVPKPVRSCLFLLQNQGTAQQFTTAPQHRAASTFQLYIGSSRASWEMTSSTFSNNMKTGGRREGAPVLLADLSSLSTMHPWPCHVPQGHQWAPTGTATCSTSGCPALPSLAPPWAVKLTNVPYFCSEGVYLLLSSTAL